MYHEEYEVAIAAFIRSNGIIRRSTACASPIQAAPAAADRAALQRYAAFRSKSRGQRVTGRDRSFWATKVLARPSE